MSDSGNTTPPGWYPDGGGGQRWWDGSQWGPVGQPPSPEYSPPTTPMPTSPPPQYAAQQGLSGSGSSGKNTKLLFAIIGGLVGVAVLAIILLLVLRGGNAASSDDPAETVAAFYDAGLEGDCETAFALLTDDARDTFDASPDDCESADPSEGFGEEITFDVGKAKIDGDDATVPVTLSGDSSELPTGGFTLEFSLKKQGGVWLIDDFGLGNVLDDLPEMDLPDATDFGDDPFSDLPDDPFSDFPTDLFSDLPSDFPTDLFSDFPTDFDPEDFLSDFPSDFLSDFPTE